ncbi:MAG: adenosylcobinamide-GDP ribazoletransferase [Gammaproteobacteria bacterium]|nr:adenosylcobinamide-GDP ribazoletransferase [Gammaproteobacteria bacterium]
MQVFLTALQFLTRLPLPGPQRIDDVLIGRSGLHYPLVGAVIGGLLTLGLGLLLWVTTAPVHETSGVFAAILLTLWVGLTGGLHLDGLADSADGWLSGADRERCLTIMRDPHTGSAAVIVVALILITKFAALEFLLSGMPDASTVFVLIMVPTIGRGAALALLLTTPSARSGGLAQTLRDHLPRRPAAIVLLVLALLSVIVLGISGLAALMAVSVGVWLLRMLMLKRIGGCTGDTAGAVTELSETVALITLCLVT